MNKVAITVVYNTPELIRNAITSIKNFDKDIKIFIVNNSDINSECTEECIYLKRAFKNVEVFNTNYNIGHGEGLHLGISLTNEKYIIVFDSDIEMVKNPLPEMINQFNPQVYGVGEIIQVNERGFNVDKGINYLHPYFAIINREKYKVFRQFKHHGAPFIDTMKDLNIKRGAKLINFDLKDYIIHYERGTRNILNGEQVERLRG